MATVLTLLLFQGCGPDDVIPRKDMEEILSEFYLTSYPSGQLVPIVNPLSSDLNVMRQTLIFNALEVIERNINHQNNNLRIFEIGNCYSFRPRIHIIDETIRTCMERSPRGAWLTATLGTINTGIYQRHAASCGYRFRVPDEAMCVEIHEVTDLLESRNNYRLPSYQRLDIGFNFHREFRSGRHRTINLSVYNVYNRNNPFLVYRVGSSLKQLSIFPIMPSLSYTFYF